MAFCNSGWQCAVVYVYQAPCCSIRLAGRHDLSGYVVLYWCASFCVEFTVGEFVVECDHGLSVDCVDG